MSANNSTIVQIRRGTSAQTASFTGALAELTVVTDEKTIAVHDGVTPGGSKLATRDFAQAGFNRANSANILAQAAFNTSNAINTYAQSAYNAANNLIAGVVANTALTYSNTAGGAIPLVNTLKPGEPSINLVDGRVFIQLNNGKVVDISSTPAGNNWYVAMNGNDNYEGNTPSSAKRTIRAAVAAAQPGDSVHVLAGNYTEITPIIIPQNVQVQGAGERTCIIRPQTAANNVFYVNNNSYVTGFKFVDYLGAAVSFPTPVLETGTAQNGTANTITLNAGASPYDGYYNSMRVQITSGTGSNQTADIIAYNGTTKVATLSANWVTIPNNTSVYSLSIPLRTSPAPTSSRYTTYITGSPYIYNSSSITTTGTGIRVDGDLAMGNKSIISAQFTQVNSNGIGIHILNDGYSQLVSIYTIFCDIGFLAESGGTASMGNCNVNFGNKGLVSRGKGKLAMTANVNGASSAASFTLNIDNVVANSALGITATVPYSGMIMKIDGDDPDTYYSVIESTPLSSGNTTVTFQQQIPVSWPDNTVVRFYQQSQLRASGQTFEYVGAGTDINALPKLGGVANTAAQIQYTEEGIVFATATDQNGNFSVSDLTINQTTSTISGRSFTKSLFAQMTPYILAIEGN